MQPKVEKVIKVEQTNTNYIIVKVWHDRHSSTEAKQTSSVKNP